MSQYQSSFSVALLTPLLPQSQPNDHLTKYIFVYLFIPFLYLLQIYLLVSNLFPEPLHDFFSGLNPKLEIRVDPFELVYWFLQHSYLLLKFILLSLLSCLFKFSFNLKHMQLQIQVHALFNLFLWLDHTFDFHCASWSESILIWAIYF
jgi:hypothetical protein